MGFWRTVLQEIRQSWRWVIAILVLLAFHFWLTGLSWGSVGPLLLILLLSAAFLKWCWRQPFWPALPGLIVGLALIFLIETYLGGSAWVFGTFDPAVNPDRQPVGLEEPIIRALGWFYAVRPGQYVELTLAALVGISLLHSALHCHRRRRGGAIEHGRFREMLLKRVEALSKCLESAGGFALVLGSLVFANAVNLKAAGLNAFATRYEQASEKLGSNVTAIGQLQTQVSNLERVDNELTNDPRSPDAENLLDATTALIDALWQLEQAEAQKSAIDQVVYKPASDPLPQLHPSLPPVGQAQSEAEIREKALVQIGHLLAVQRRAEAAEQRAHQLAHQRAIELPKLAFSIGVALAEAQRLTPPEKVNLLKAIAQRLATLVARDGAARAAQEIRNLAAQVRKKAEAQDQADTDRRADVARYRQALEDYMSQRQACVQTAKTAGDFLQHDPDGALLASKLKSYAAKDGTEKREGGKSPLLAQPQWHTPSDANDSLTDRFKTEISQRLYNRPLPPVEIMEGYPETLKTAYRAVGGNTNSPGFRLLESWIEDSCGQGGSPATLIAQLRERARQKAL